MTEPMTMKGGTSQACAACKYQRRKCSAECPLAPYFPPDQPKLFQNAHRLFGVSNIVKILNKIEPTQKTEAMRSIIYEANVRDRYPAHGCLGLIFTLHLQIQHTQMELDAVNAQLAIHRHRPFQLHLVSSSSSSSSSNTCHAAANYPPFDAPSTVISIADNSDSSNNGDKKVEAFWTHNSYNNGSATCDSVFAITAAGMHPPFEVVGGMVEHDYDEISPYFHTIDEDRAYESRFDE